MTPPPSPPLPPSPPRPPSAPYGALIFNERFRSGSLSSRDLAGAGVLLHQFDGFDDADPHGRPDDGFGDRMSASLISQAAGTDPRGNLPLYSFSLAGIILNPKHNKMSCGWAFDAGTTQFTSPPGCGSGNRVNWCGGDDVYRMCAWGPERLPELLASNWEIRRNGWKPNEKVWDDGKFYNEVILDMGTYRRNLPHSIDAVFYLEPSDCVDVFNGPKCKDYGITAHKTIKRKYGLGDSELPLVKLNLWDLENPFSNLY